nr:MAG TPA: hypothetical protein [Caudoviricetes sp.]
MIYSAKEYKVVPSLRGHEPLGLFICPNSGGSRYGFKD